MRLGFVSAILSELSPVHLKNAKILPEVGALATPLEYHAPKLPGLGEVEDRSFEGSLDAKKPALRQSHNSLMQFLPD